MKKTAGIILMLWCIVAGVMTLKAQDTVTHYKSYFGQQSTRWVCVEGSAGFYYQVFISSDRDTVMDGMLYHITYDSLYMDYSHFFYDNRVYMREDTITGRLWVRTDNGEEVLVADMTLEIGDSVLFYYPESYEYLDDYYNNILYRVVDIVFDSNGKNIVLCNMEYYSDNVTIIEGIGPSLLATYMSGNEVFGLTFYHHHDLECQMKDGEYVYQTPFCPFCICPLFSSIESGDESVAPTIVPNPGHDWITINVEDEFGMHAEFYNMQGMRMMVGHTRTVDVSTLPRGLYIVRVYEVGKGYNHYKFVKQ